MLTDAQIRKLPEPAADRLINAGTRDGLYLRHRAATGRKTWVLRRRVGGEWVVETLGDWPKLTAINARRRAGTTEAKIGDAITFGEAAQEFYRQVIARRYRSAPKDTLAYFTRDCEALLTRRLDRVKRLDLSPIVRAKANGTAKLAPAPAAATKLLALLKQFYRWALVEELLDADPTAGLTARSLNLPAYEPRERVLTDGELKALFAIPDEPYGRLLRFSLLTGCRIGEAIGFDPGQVSGDIWTIPMTKNGKPHSVPLSPTAAALAAAGWPPRTYDAVHMFFMSKALPWRPHDLRRTAATRMRDAGVSVEAIEAVLNHAPPRLVRVYQRPNMVPLMRDALVILDRAVAEVVHAE